MKHSFILVNILGNLYSVTYFDMPSAIIQRFVLHLKQLFLSMFVKFGFAAHQTAVQCGIFFFYFDTSVFEILGWNIHNITLVVFRH